ncbi:MAG: alpha/beta hydrolase, partial [Planctomycetaceae bacterium]|nr:alpha/beta hydrolase [Planctomycetaceae bacterium]
MTDELMAPGRLAQGYVIVLPGIEGHSFLNRSIVRGLVAGGVPFGIEIYDWTTGLLGYFRNLRDRTRHRTQAEVIAGKIAHYREEHPAQPVYLVGHSGGGAMTLFTLERLPAAVQVNGGIMLVPAISPDYNVSPALAATQRGLWSFSSWGDIFIVGLGTLLCGTCDGKHCPSAGMTGFSSSVRAAHRPHGPGPVLHQVPFRR